MPVYKYKKNIVDSEGKKKTATFYYVMINKNGRQFCKRGFAEKSDALAYESMIFNSTTKKKKRDFKCSELQSVFFEYLKKRYKITAYYRYQSLFKCHIFPFFNSCKISSIDNVLLEKIANNVNASSYRDKKNIFFATKLYLTFLSQYGMPPVNDKILFVHKECKRIESKKFDYYLYDEFMCFLNVIVDKRDRFIFILLFFFGLRIGELRGLKKSDFVYNRVFIKRCITNKTDKGHQIVVDPKTPASIREYPIIDMVEIAYNEYMQVRSKCKSQFLFAVDEVSDVVIGESTIKRLQKRYCELSNLRVIKLHEFRHSCASDLINNGFTAQQVADWLGHSDYSVTIRIYSHLFPSRKLEIGKFYNKR